MQTMSRVVKMAGGALGRGVSSAAEASAVVEGLCPVQEGYLSEECLRVDEADAVVGRGTKREVHSWAAVEAGRALHRAFSVFIFNPQGEMLLQRRSETKITFPGLWTNACCSHPLASLAGEAEEADGMGVRRAAQRKLRHELGLAPDQVPLHALRPVARFLYCARCPPPRDQWGEHELDHALLLTDFPHQPRPDPNEVSQTAWVDQQRLQQLISQGSEEFSPWFLLAQRHFLPQWWPNLHRPQSLDRYHTIRSLH